MIRMSHNDEWCTHPIDDARNAGCQILDVDIVYDRGTVYTSHSKRWFRCMYRGKLETYIRKMTADMILYLDIKDASPKLAEAVIALFREYVFVHPVLIGGDADPARQAIADYIQKTLAAEGLNIKLFSEFAVRNEIQSVDVFGAKHWWMY